MEHKKNTGKSVAETGDVSKKNVYFFFKQRTAYELLRSLVGTEMYIRDRDGTREFISRNGEFTVNIALINNGVPVLGVVYVPVHDVCYAGCHSANSRIALNDALSVKSTDIDLYTHSYACKISNSHSVDIPARCA